MKKWICYMLCILGMLTFASCGKKAEPIDLPKADDVKSVMITIEENTIEHTENKWIRDLIADLSEAKSTSKESVQEVPQVAEYIQMDLKMQEETMNLTLYEYEEKWYVEHPYVGIYEIDSSLYERLMKEYEEAFKIKMDSEGMTLESRFGVPNGFARCEKPEGSLAEFIAQYPLKEAGSDVLLYDGRKKYNQNAHAAVFALPIEDYDLQQCADSIMRMYGEYYYKKGQYDKIRFHFSDGFLAEYDKWARGYRIKMDGDHAYWAKTSAPDSSYDSFVSFMRIVFSYAGTMSMEDEAEAISMEECRVGDVFLTGGSPGHVVMIVDLCENEKGEKAFLLAQGYMPAQEFHILKNPAHEDNPWYYETEIEEELNTPEYHFSIEDLKRLEY